MVVAWLAHAMLGHRGQLCDAGLCLPDSPSVGQGRLRMTKLWHAFHSITGCLLVLGLLCPMVLAQQPQEARLAIDHAPFTTAQRRGAPWRLKHASHPRLASVKPKSSAVPWAGVILQRYRWQPGRRTGIGR